MPFSVVYNDIGLKEYKEAWDYQELVHKSVLKEREKNTDAASAGMLIFCEHPHVFTLGKSGRQNNLLINENFLKKINASYYHSNRGGDITYHGPGQIVGYPIFDLEKMKLGVKTYIHRIEESIIQTLKEYKINASRLDGATGVWLDTNTPKVRKICAIGVRISRAITMHGFAFNVNTDLSYFSYINPCGLPDKGVTSLQKELGATQELNKVKEQLKTRIAELFNLELS